MLFLKNIRFTLLCLMICSQINAQHSFTSLQDIWAYADKHNMEIKSLEAGKAVAQKNLQQAYGSVLPTLSANGSFSDNIKIQSTLVPASLFNPAAPAGTYTEATFGRRYIYNANALVQFDLLNTQDWFAIKAQKLNNEIAALNIAKFKADLYEQLANAYYSYLLLSRAGQLAEENLRTTATLYDIAKNKYNEGQISEVTMNTALISKEKAEKSIGIAVENKSLQLNNLKLLLNTNDSISISEDKREREPLIADGVFSHDPEVQLSYSQMLLSKTQWQSSKSAFVPSLSFIYQYNTQVAADEFLKFNNSNSTPQQYWGLRLSVPIFNGNARRYQVQKSKIDYDLKHQQYEASKLKSGITNKNIWLSFNAARVAFEKSESILKLYQANDVHAERRMNEGLIPMDERLRVYSDLITNQNEYLQSMSDYFIQEYRLRIRQTNFTE